MKGSESVKHLSKRIREINDGGSDGWDVYYRARAMKTEGGEILELTVGDHDFRTPSAIIDAMHRSARAGNTGYAPVPGATALRRAVAARIESRTGVPTSHRNVLVTAGGQAALLAAHMSCLDAGDTGLYFDPYYATFPGCIRATGATARTVPAPAANRFRPVPEDLEAYVDATTRTLLVNSPNNPTGAVYDSETLAGIAEVCQRRDLWLISDEVYDTQVWKGVHLSPRALPGMAERTLVVGSLSKSHAMTGFRCGWVVGPEDAISGMIEFCTVSTYGVPGFVQDAALHALTRGDAIEERVAGIFRRRLGIAKASLAGANAIRMVPAHATMYVLLDVCMTGLSGIEFANRLLDEENIAVMPGESFGCAAAGHVRVALTCDDAHLTEALERIATFASNAARTA